MKSLSTTLNLFYNSNSKTNRVPWVALVDTKLTVEIRHNLAILLMSLLE